MLKEIGSGLDRAAGMVKGSLAVFAGFLIILASIVKSL